jgi:glycosyltransferase involved in cell wall biosynthesis
MTKLIIQIPCYNEENTLSDTLAALPKKLPGVDVIETLIIDDGSRDRTVEVARSYGVDHIVSFPTNQGLAKGFMAGLDACLRAGADIIVNTDADNQYCADDIAKLIQPILEGKAEIVIGARPINQIEHFSPVKKALQKLGSFVVRVASQTDVPDAPSGFRAISRDAAMRFNVFGEYTYTLETIIQTGQKGMAITSVPVRTNPYTRPSRLMKNMASYVKRSVSTILHIYLVYKPRHIFNTLGAIFFSAGFLLGIRWLILYWSGTQRSHIPSLILAAILILMGFQLWIFSLIAYLSEVNRKLLEDVQLRLRRFDYMRKADKLHNPSEETVSRPR